MFRARNQQDPSAGFTLIEVVLAVLLLSTTLMGTLTLSSTVLRSREFHAKRVRLTETLMAATEWVDGLQFDLDEANTWRSELCGDDIPTNSYDLSDQYAGYSVKANVVKWSDGLTKRNEERDLQWDALDVPIAGHECLSDAGLFKVQVFASDKREPEQFASQFNMTIRLQ